MPAAEFLVFGSIAAAVICWAMAEILRPRHPGWGWLWTAGALLTLLHSLAAFVVFYDSSHAVARDETMRQTQRLTGITFVGGIYINYLLLVVWNGDAGWWVMARRGYAHRPPWLAYAIRGFIFFIILNGAVIFADGAARTIGAVAVALVGASWFLKRSSRRDGSITGG